ncbi:uncharacterized protein LOC124888914 [Capsicum annuum]|uniref:uncharacterized protein LOC124888914 n=1 Tax=Capsicum annuum TaxID=4072 RepID=UPI001FB08AE7|nr:uncharacterized protein LOC124888914 [Capsicum annuum]
MLATLNQWQPDTLSSNTVQKPKNGSHCHAITTRSSKTTIYPPIPTVSRPKNNDDHADIDEAPKVKAERSSDVKSSSKKDKDTIDEEFDVVTILIEERLGVKALAIVIMNLDSNRIKEYDDMEVVKKENIKWVDASVVYPIADSKWCYFMVKKVIVLGHKILKRGIGVDKAKIEVMDKFPPPILVKEIQIVLGHTGFYRRFIKDFSKIANTLCKLLEKDVKFDFDEACLKSFEFLKERLVSAPIIVSLD